MNDAPERFIVGTDDRVSVGDMTIPIIPWDPHRKDATFLQELNDLGFDLEDPNDVSSDEETIRSNDRVLWRDVKAAIMAFKEGHGAMLIENYRIEELGIKNIRDYLYEDM